VVPLALSSTKTLLDVRATLQGKRLLIVDDNATHRKLLTLQAQFWGMDAIAVGTGAKALDVVQQHSFDLLILDSQLPLMTGLTLAEAIRQQPRFQEMPLILLTSIGKSDSTLGAKGIKVAAYLSKPLKHNQLVQVMVQVLRERIIQTVPATPAPPNQPLGQLHPLRILLAEDHRVNQKMALLMLQRLGYQAEVASNGLEVLEALRCRVYDVVLMDVQMPEMDGLTATRHICQDWQIRPRIVAMTANAMQGDRQLCLNAGMDDYITKPIRVNELVEALEKCRPLSKDFPEDFPKGSGAAETSGCSPTLDNLQDIRKTAGADSPEDWIDILGCYLEDSPTLLQQLRQSFEQADLKTLRRITHTLKSSSAMLGALQLAQLCHQLEVALQANEIPSHGLEQIRQIELEYDRVQAALSMERSRCNQQEMGLE
jgi:CheY-like chemotaxis protein/HPt (histidine-containing phosphotransfer) domain-containing protein